MESPLTKQRGEFTGSYNAASGYYTGTYTNAVGELHRDLNPGIEYYIAPDGSWALFPVERSLPAGFETRVAANAVRWARSAWHSAAPDSWRNEWAERIGIRGPGWLICLKECRFLGAEGPHEVHLRPLEI
jgi:hypothetical protein